MRLTRYTTRIWYILSDPVMKDERYLVYKFLGSGSLAVISLVTSNPAGNDDTILLMELSEDLFVYMKSVVL